MLADPYAPVLVVHAAALLAVLDHSHSSPERAGPVSREEVLSRLLAHEGRYWQQSQDALRLGLDTEVARRAVAAACLIGADDEAAATRLLAAIADLSDSARLRGKRPGGSATCTGPQPGAGGEWIGSLQPDLLAERLVVSVLAGQPALIPALFTELPASRAGPDHPGPCRAHRSGSRSTAGPAS